MPEMTAVRTQAVDALPRLIEIAKKAGEEILAVYGTSFSVLEKADRSPLTQADRRSHEIIAQALAMLDDLPVLSEEGKSIPYSVRKAWTRFWLVDPLDGTKEFVNRNGEFTVNIALIENGSPVLAVIYVPVSGVLYHAEKGRGARRIKGGVTTALPIAAGSGHLRIVGSRSHASAEFTEYAARLKARYPESDFVSAGSSLKFCLVAEGTADVYPRLGPTMEWDTAAGQLIVEEAGGSVEEAGTRATLAYNKSNLLNPHFIAYRRGIDV
jgi:3'(2'), 5'-bisphosphate nucleotidase